MKIQCVVFFSFFWYFKSVVLIRRYYNYQHLAMTEHEFLSNRSLIRREPGFYSSSSPIAASWSGSWLRPPSRRRTKGRSGCSLISGFCLRAADHRHGACRIGAQSGRSIWREPASRPARISRRGPRSFGVQDGPLRALCSAKCRRSSWAICRGSSGGPRSPRVSKLLLTCRLPRGSPVGRPALLARNNDVKSKVSSNKNIKSLLGIVFQKHLSTFP